MAEEAHQKSGPELARHIGLFSLIVYGVGDMVGAGIYGTIGVAAGVLGNAVWLSFAISMVAALLTGLCYASLGSRYPKAGGAAYVTQKAYGIKFLSYVVGLAVTASGLTSMAAGSNVFATTLAGIFPKLTEMYPVMAVKIILVGFLLVVALINFIGIKESMTANLVCTAVEVGGLLFIIFIGVRYWGDVNYFQVPEGSTLGLSMLMSGAVLTFYAFVGFEDMLNVGEEVKDPQKTLPKGIIIALVVATIIYILVSITAVSVVEARSLADPKLGAPLAQIVERAAPWMPTWVYTAITMFAVANTALLNGVMGSRLLYGMARQGLVPKRLADVHPRFRTPHIAILALTVVVLLLGLSGTIKELASATSLLLLSCFCLVNGALLVLQGRPEEPKGHMEIPRIVPVLGVIVCVCLIIARVKDEIAKLQTANSDANVFLSAPMIAGLIILVIAALYLVLRPKSVVEPLDEDP
jgi:APA family basic amino acid/polyamine antiporter